MKYYKLFAILILAGMMACSGEKKEKGSEESVETVLPDETNEVTVMKLNTTDFNHELISNGKLSARNFVDLKFESAEPIAKIYVKNGDRVTKGQKLAELSTFRLANKTAASQRCTRTRQTGTARRTDRTGLQTGRFYKSTARNHAVSQGKKRV